MKVQLNTDNNITASDELRASYSTLISEELKRFDEHITRLEVHLSDENSHKDGMNDKRCMIEARLRGKQPIAVSNQANTLEPAITGAVDKLKTSLDTILGRLRNH